MVTEKRGQFLLVLVVFLLVFLVYSVDAAGCYTYQGNDESLYCQSGVEREDAKRDCDLFADCDLSQYFTEGSDCSEIPETCEQIRCNVDCNTHAREWCRQLGLNDQFREGQEVTDFNLQCALGCCKVDSGSFLTCNFGLTQYQCDLRAARAGVDLASRIFINTPGMNAQQCQVDVCQAPVNLIPVSGKVTETDGSLISAVVTLIVDGTPISATYDSSSGNYFFSGLNPGTHRIRVTAPGYTPQTITLSILSGQAQVTLDIILELLTELATLSGSVLDKSSGTGIGNVLVVWGNAPNARATTRNNGQFEFTLGDGTYTITISKDGYRSEQRRVTVKKGEALNLPPFELDAIPFQGIRGITSVDLDGYGNFQIQSAVKIFVNGVFKGFSQIGGQYQVQLDEGEQVVVGKFQFQKNYESRPQLIEIEEGAAVNLDLQLTAPEGECDEPGEEKSVELFIASAIPGKKEVLLQWGRPCPEVQGYEIKKSDSGRTVEIITKPVTAGFLKDSTNLEWGKEYSYEIIAVYDNNRRSPQAALISITLGDAECEGKYNELSSQWATFCELSQKKRVFTCNEDNRVVSWSDCSQQDIVGQKDFYCARLGDDSADCKDAGICAGIIGQPFGVFHSRDLCYGTASPEAGQAVNYCFYDSPLKTITNQCQSCTAIESCFNYRSKDACEINNCIQTACQWVDGASLESQELVDYSLLYPHLDIPAVFVTSETGSGYCVEQNFEGNQCGLCSENAELFENYFCTADVCTNLGRCFSNHPSHGQPLSSCSSCGPKPDEDNNCYAYTTELECTKGSSVQDINGLVIESLDSCSWGRCRWDGGSCVKDGDATQDDDCESFRDRDRLRCKSDNDAPGTLIVPEGFRIISSAASNVTFKGYDNSSPMGTLHYCLISSESVGSCVLSSEGINYPGRNQEERVSINLIDSEVITGRRIPGETFLLRYASKDKFFNLEDVQEAFIYVDNVAPEFTITEEIYTVGDRTNLKIILNDIVEPAKCTLALKKTLPVGETRSDIIGRNEINKEIQYTDLMGVGFNLNATCEDDYGNVVSKQNDYTFDLEENIDIINPHFRGIIAQTSVMFEIKTDVGAICQLYDKNNQRIADFVTDETAKEHQTALVSGFIEREYPAEHKVVCRELLDQNQVFEDYFHFTVDFTPPSTKIILREGGREVQPLIYGWEEFFIKNVSADFECRSDGFNCDKIFYCLGEGCDYIGNENFVEYTGTVQLTESNLICYYSTDVAGSEVFQPNCGTVSIVGYGITLEKPEPHYYKNEVWGVSANPTFTWQFSTVVPTAECRFDFKENFNFEDVASYKIKEANAQGKYIYEDFPESVFSDYPVRGGVKRVYVKCINADGDISPEQKMNLEYDPSNPEILDKFADPDPVYEGSTTGLFTSTDDKTLCRYSDNSEGDGSAQYQTMEYSFPGTMEKLLGEIHEDIFNINFIGSKKTFNLNLQCINGACSSSGVESLSFLVDYSEKGNIDYLYPNGQTLAARDVTLQARTTKGAFCEYKPEDDFERFDTTDSLSHSKIITNLEEREYLIPVRCMISDHKVEGLIKFRIDLTTPEIYKIEDGNFTCGNGNLSIFTYSNETNVTVFDYEVYDKGLTALKIGGSKIFEGSTNGHLPIKISTENLLENHTYSVRIRARDAAGNQGKFAESNGIVVVNSNHTACLNDIGAPSVSFAVDRESSCSAIYVEMFCTDGSGCNKFRYGLSATSETCETNRDYNGRKLEFTKSGFVCIYVEDATGNNYTETKEIIFQDEDSDGIADGCDVCEETKAGKVAGDKGCSEDQVPPTEKNVDTDKDSLPDVWEQNYNSPTCSLDYLAIDSDGNDISDNREDYDSDGRSSFEEYLAGTDPCVADKETPKEPVAKKPAPVLPKEGDLLAWIFLIVGLALVLGGIGYLTYFYQTLPGTAFGTQRPLVEKIQQTVGLPTETLPQRELSRSKRKRAEGTRKRKRESFFGAFTREATGISPITPLLKGEEPLSKVKKTTQKYADHKEEINKELKSSDKSVFAKLERVIKEFKPESKSKVNVEETEDVFSKLKNLSKKRKQK